MSDVAPYTAWIDYGLDGWKPFDCQTVEECLDVIAQYGGDGYRITRPVQLVDAAGYVVSNRAPQTAPHDRLMTDHGR